MTGSGNTKTLGFGQAYRFTGERVYHLTAGDHSSRHGDSSSKLRVTYFYLGLVGLDLGWGVSHYIVLAVLELIV